MFLKRYFYECTQFTCSDYLLMSPKGSDEWPSDHCYCPWESHKRHWGLGETQDDDISCKITVGSFCSAAFLKWGNFNTTIFFVRKTREQFVHCGAPDNGLCTDTKSLYHRSPDGSTQCGWKMCTLVVIPINDNILPHCIKYGNVYFQSNVFSHLIIHPLCLAVVR